MSEHAHGKHEHAHGEHDHAHDHDHDHAHDHDHDHDHDHAPPPRKGAPTGAFTPREAKQARRLMMVLALVGVFFVLEFAGAIAARSVVLQADALHLLMDVFALAMSLVAMRLAVRRPTPRFTFGLRRAEPVAAIFNAMLVLGATVQIIRQAIDELRGNEVPEAGIMLVVACGALVVNGLSAWLLHGAIHHGHDHDHAPADPAHPPKAVVEDPDNPHAKKTHGHALNLRGAWLHLVGDTLGSIAAIIAAIVIRFGGSAAVDPFASFLVALILVAGAIRLIRDATLVLLEASPPHLPVGAIREVILGFPGVREVHDLHVWTLGAGHDAITVHVHAAIADPTLSSRLSQKLREKFDVEYVTVQIELGEDACGAPPSLYKSQP
jgi:cation diffusion facilitator family transporter